MTIEPDIIIVMRFKTADEGGRKTPIVGEFYACVLFVDGEGFDCRVFLGGRTVELGVRYRLPVKFLYPEFAMPKLAPGKPIALWEGKEIALGEVLELLPTA